MVLLPPLLATGVGGALPGLLAGAVTFGLTLAYLSLATELALFFLFHPLTLSPSLLPVSPAAACISAAAGSPEVLEIVSAPVASKVGSRRLEETERDLHARALAASLASPPPAGGLFGDLERGALLGALGGKLSAKIASDPTLSVPALRSLLAAAAAVSSLLSSAPPRSTTVGPGCVLHASRCVRGAAAVLRASVERSGRHNVLVAQVPVLVRVCADLRAAVFAHALGRGGGGEDPGRAVVTRCPHLAGLVVAADACVREVAGALLDDYGGEGKGGLGNIVQLPGKDMRYVEAVMGE
ncbi:hypothetical protein TeGR_g692 [Tetraparma gracilis]|uniref:Uncharacterized protein n=1 Tax=Tetraparma gracilis TaxID=2962635 RepID=A0ABQ6M7P4_9STRA|nr:hypothetical protein TeGR_g692 [Tetraparma gracilis]